jgi:hypothetical protein
VGVATILVDSNVPQDRLTGYAVANPGNQDLNIRIVLVDSQGIEVQTIRPPALNPLPPGGQYAMHDARNVLKIISSCFAAITTSSGLTGL